MKEPRALTLSLHSQLLRILVSKNQLLWILRYGNFIHGKMKLNIFSIGRISQSIKKHGKMKLWRGARNEVSGQQWPGSSPLCEIDSNPMDLYIHRCPRRLNQRLFSFPNVTYLLDEAYQKWKWKF
ncbi:hypothetical protein V6N11_051769 [Hibiscus sabdariffa]|uniref:Uncharacterized protein n=1 Tax=Hibiscus sabdariffa TaxID=183260 RepID=A0ABR2U815_9ROSI